MARRQSIESRRQLKALVTPAELRSTALNTGFLKRDRKLNLFNLLWSLTLGSDGPGPRKLTAIYQSYLFVASKRDTVHRSAFFKWLARPELADWLREVLDLVMCRLEEQGASADERLAGVLGQFREIYTTDSSILQLRESLEKLFPGARTNSSPAAMKIHVIQQVGGSGLRSVELTPGRTNDLKAFQPGPWLRGSLCINDLGYYDFWTFQRIEHFGGFFISRMKSNGNPRILRSHLKHRGRKVDIDGRKLKDVLPKLKRKTLDVEVEVTYTEKTTGARKPLRLRLVGIWDRADRCYHLYFTNVPPEVMKATDIANAYRLRWQVELLFRELKGVHQLDQLPSEKPSTVEALVYASLLAGMVTRRLLDAIRARLDLIEAELPFEKGARIIRQAAPMLLKVLTLPARLARPLATIVEDWLLTLVETTKIRRRNLLSERLDLRGHPDLEIMMGSAAAGS